MMIADIIYTISTTKNELSGILELQTKNLSSTLTKDEMEKEGFLTVRHTYEELKKLNDIENHIIAKDGTNVIGYLLAMTSQSKFDLPVLVPMFETFNKLKYAGKIIDAYKYIVVGQVCVDKAYRSMGVLDKCYMEYKTRFRNKYDFAITEIASANMRSLNAHKRIGFKEICRHTANDNTEWCIVLWDWKEQR